MSCKRRHTAPAANLRAEDFCSGIGAHAAHKEALLDLELVEQVCWLRRVHTR